MPELEMQTPEGIRLRLELAGAGSRYGAALIDVIVYGIVWLGAFTVAMLASNLTGLGELAASLLVIGSALLWIVLLTAVHVGLQGRSPGKAVFGLRVVGEEGNPASVWQHGLRSILWLVDVLPVPLPLGLIVMVVSPRSQRLGDMVAGTLVVHEPRRQPVVEPWPRERYDDLQLRELHLTPALAARFDGEDLDFLRDVITRRGMGHDGRQALYDKVTRHYLERLGQEGPVAARVALKELYLFLREQRGA